MEGNPKPNNPNKALEILRRSTHLFLRCRLHHYNPTVYALPFSLTVLLHLCLSARSSSATDTIHRRLHSVLLSAGFPVSSSAFPFHLLNLSQLTLSYPQVSAVPILFYLLHMSKSATIEFVKHYLRHRHHDHPNPPYPSFYPLLYTHICCTFLLIAANSACFFLLRDLFTHLVVFHPWISAAGSIVYFFVVATAVAVCNLALIMSGWEAKGGFLAILRAIVLIRGRVSTALAVALPANLALAAVEAVFWCITHGFDTKRWIWAVLPGIGLLSFVYSVLIVGDTVVGCLLYQSCKEEEEEVVAEEEHARGLKNLGALEDGFIH